MPHTSKTWKDYAAQIITLAVIVVGAAVAWGAVSTNVTANKVHLEKHDTKFDECGLDRASIRDRVSKSEARQGMVIDMLKAMDRKLDRALRRR